MMKLFSKVVFTFLLFILSQAAYANKGSYLNIRVLQEENFQKIADAAYFLANHLEFSQDVILIISIKPNLPHSVNGYTLCEENYHGTKQLYVNISSKLSLKSQLSVLAHEMVHVKQFMNEDLIKKQDQCYQWKGDTYQNVNLLNYFNRPWEQEAIEMQHDLVQLYKTSASVQKSKD